MGEVVDLQTGGDGKSKSEYVAVFSQSESKLTFRVFGLSGSVGDRRALAEAFEAAAQSIRAGIAKGEAS